MVGTITIPLMMRYGVPGTFAAAVETSASMGGLIMPPMMGVGAFLMSEFLGVPYWDVVLRGFALAFVYYVSIGVAVYLLCVRLLPRDAIERPQVPLYDKVKTTIFFSSVLYLLYLMGFVGKGELLAALYTATFMFVLLVVALLLFQIRGQGPGARERDAARQHAARDRDPRRDDVLSDAAARNARHHDRPVHRHRLHQPDGRMLIDLGAWNIIAMIVMAWIFGWLAGAGLPPTATYIIGAVVIVRPMQELGINPWIAHFFVFLLSVWGELSPPTSLTAAVSARIANASFLQDHVRGAEDLRADHADDVRDLHALQHGGESGLDADRRHNAGAGQHARHHLRHVRALSHQREHRHLLRCLLRWSRSS